MIDALIPSAALPVGPLPPAPPPTLPTSILMSDSEAGALAIGVGHLDRSGWVQDRVLTSALGWTAGRRLSLDVVAGLILLRASTAGRHTIDNRSTLPRRARHAVCAESGAASGSSYSPPYASSC